MLVDYAHNPDGLRGFLQVADQLRASGARIGLLLGHAGNRHDADIAELARVAAGFKPDLIVSTENEAQLRGRAPGEVPRILRAALLAAGMPDATLPVCASELEAARFALDWARPGDVPVLPIHSAAARRELIAALEGGTRHWRAASALAAQRSSRRCRLQALLQVSVMRRASSRVAGPALSRSA